MDCLQALWDSLAKLLLGSLALGFALAQSLGPVVAGETAYLLRPKPPSECIEQSIERGRAARAARLTVQLIPHHPQTWLSSFLPRSYTLTQSTRRAAHIFFPPPLCGISTLPLGVYAIVQELERASNRTTAAFRPFSLLS